MLIRSTEPPIFCRCGYGLVWFVVKLIICNTKPNIKSVNPIFVKSLEFCNALLRCLSIPVKDRISPPLRYVSLKCSKATIDVSNIFVVLFNAIAKIIAPIVLKQSPAKVRMFIWLVDWIYFLLHSALALPTKSRKSDGVCPTCIFTSIAENSS